MIVTSSLQEEMVLAFLFLPYLAGYLLLNLNIQVAADNIYINTKHQSNIYINTIYLNIIRWSSISI